MRVVSFDLLHCFSSANIFFHSIHNIVERMLLERRDTGIDFRILVRGLYRKEVLF